MFAHSAGTVCSPPAANPHRTRRSPCCCYPSRSPWAPSSPCPRSRSRPPPPSSRRPPSGWSRRPRRSGTSATPTSSSARPGSTSTTFDTEADIYYLEGSLGLFDFLYLFGSYQNQDFDIQDTDADLWTLGIGGHLDVTNRVNVLGELSYLFTDVSSSINELEDSNSGYRLYGGARWMALPWNRGGLEVAGGLGYLDLKDRPASDDSVFLWDLGLRAHFIKLLSVGAFYEMQGDDDQVSVNVRVSF